MNIGMVIKNLRLKRNISQQELVEKLGISQGFLSLIERGEREPGFELVNNIANAMNVPQQLIFLLACDSDSKNMKTFSKPLKKIANAIDDILKVAAT